MSNDGLLDGHIVVGVSSRGRPVHHLVLVLSRLQERELDLVTSKTGQSVLKFQIFTYLYTVYVGVFVSELAQIKFVRIMNYLKGGLDI